MTVMPGPAPHPYRALLKPPIEAPPGAFLEACTLMDMTPAEGRKAALASWTTMVIATLASRQ